MCAQRASQEEEAGNGQGGSSASMNPSSLSFSFILDQPTAPGYKEPLAYLGRGEPYKIRMICSGTLSGILKSVVSLLQDDSFVSSEQEFFEKWSHEHNQRPIEIDGGGCVGISWFPHCQQAPNAISFLWSGSAVLSLKINCCYYETTSYLRPRRISQKLRITTKLSETEALVSQAACAIKVFRNASYISVAYARAKSKEQKRSVTGSDQFHPPESVTHFTNTLPLSPNLLSTPTSPQQASSPKPQKITSTSTVKETQDWLCDNNFIAYSTLFENFSGSDLVSLNRGDLIELCGAADGIRLYNALRAKSSRTIYVRLEHEKVYQSLCLERLDVKEVQEKVASKLQLPPTQVTTLARQTTSGILVLIDDTIAQEFKEEESFVVAKKEMSSGKYEVTMKLAL